MGSAIHTEQARLGELHALAILDTDPEVEFDDLTALAATICVTPIAFIALIDERRQWFKSRIGLDVNETPRAIAFCDQTIRLAGPLIVPDALQDERFRNNPLVVGDPNIRFYAGVPLVSAQGLAIGTISVVDTVPRTLSDEQLQALQKLAGQVMIVLKLRTSLVKMRRVLQEKHCAGEALKQVHAELEKRVHARGAELTALNHVLSQEVLEKIRERSLSESVLNSLPGVFYLFDRAGTFLRWNRNLEQVSGFSAAEIARMRPTILFAADSESGLVAERIAEAFAGGQATVEASLCTAAGARVPYLFNASRIRIDGADCICGLGMDITVRKAAERVLLEAEERFRHLVELSPDAIFVLKGERCSFANAAGLALLGARGVDAMPDPTAAAAPPDPLALIHPDEREAALALVRRFERERLNVPRSEQTCVRLDGATIDVEVAGAAFTDGGAPAHLLVVRDITEANRQRHQLEQQANFDALTGLANRHLLMDRAQQCLINARRNHTLMAVALVDLDNFKLINDTLGHEMGDRLLVQMAARLHECVRGNDTVARYGGDEFVLVLGDLTGEQATAAWMARLCERIGEPFYIHGHEFFVTSSIGVSFFPRDGDNVHTLQKHADAAMYEAKADGKNGFRIFRPSMNKRVHNRFSMEIKLRHAVERGQFVLHYQPQVNIDSGRIVGCEALVRWLEPEVGMHWPLEFIAIAEETGLIVQIGQWVMEQACRDIQALRHAGHDLSVSVNLSPRQFAPDTLAATVQAALAQSGLAPGALKLELTESALMHRPERAQKTMHALREMGVRMAIDDFGIGYSSLSYLQRFPLDQLKIDQSFIRHLTENAGDAAITQAIISLAHSLKLNVIAEGVSDQRQLSYLRAHGCDEAQGYLFSRAVPLAQLARLVALPARVH